MQGLKPREECEPGDNASAGSTQRLPEWMASSEMNGSCPSLQIVRKLWSKSPTSSLTPKATTIPCAPKLCPFSWPFESEFTERSQKAERLVRGAHRKPNYHQKWTSVCHIVTSTRRTCCFFFCLPSDVPPGDKLACFCPWSALCTLTCQRVNRRSVFVFSIGLYLPFCMVRVVTRHCVGCCCKVSGLHCFRDCLGALGRFWLLTVSSHFGVWSCRVWVVDKFCADPVLVCGQGQ